MSGHDAASGSRTRGAEPPPRVRCDLTDEGTGGWTHPFNVQVADKGLFGPVDVGPTGSSGRTDLRS